MFVPYFSVSIRPVAMTFHSFLSLVPLGRTLNTFVIKRLNTRGVWGVFFELSREINFVVGRNPWNLFCNLYQGNLLMFFFYRFTIKLQRKARIRCNKNIHVSCILKKQLYKNEIKCQDKFVCNYFSIRKKFI